MGGVALFEKNPERSTASAGGLIDVELGSRLVINNANNREELLSEENKRFTAKCLLLDEGVRVDLGMLNALSDEKFKAVFKAVNRCADIKQQILALKQKISCTVREEHRARCGSKAEVLGLGVVAFIVLLFAVGCGVGGVSAAMNGKYGPAVFDLAVMILFFGADRYIAKECRLKLNMLMLQNQQDETCRQCSVELHSAAAPPTTNPLTTG